MVWSEEEAIRRLEERLLRPQVRKSGDEVASLLADEFVEIGSSGKIYDRQQIIEGLQQEPAIERSLTDFRARQLAPDIALATYRAFRCVPGRQEIHSVRSSIWKRLDGRWQMVFHQGTLLKASG